MNLGGFSWRRALGLSAAKARLSRRIGLPLTKSVASGIGKIVSSGGSLVMCPDVASTSNQVDMSSRQLQARPAIGFHQNGCSKAGVVPLHEISEWLGHANIQTTSIYLRTKRPSLLQAVERLERIQEQPKRPEKKAKPRRPASTHVRSVTVN